MYVFWKNLRTHSDYSPIQHWLIGFYNRDGVCLLRGTSWLFKYDTLIFYTIPLLWRFGFDAESIHMLFLLVRMAMGQVSRRVRGVSPVSVIPPLLPTHLHPHAAITTGCGRKKDTEIIFIFLESTQNAVLHQRVLNKTSLKWRLWILIDVVASLGSCPWPWESFQV